MKLTCFICSVVALCGFLVAFVAIGCSKKNRVDSQPTVTPIVVFGVDGLEWNVMLPMLRAGRLPNFAKLMERGYYGKLATFVPTFSPVIWTTIATGKRHSKHGIHNFARRLPDDKITLFNNLDRKTKAVWNILSDYDKSVVTIGWWMTHPVEPINGIMVAQTNTRAQLDTRFGKHIWKGTLRKGVPNQVYPPERQNEMISILEAVERGADDLAKEIFGEFQFPLSLLGERLWGNCQWAFRADATYLKIAHKLAQSQPMPDLTLIYLGGPDVVGHRFWRYMVPQLYRHRPTSEQIANFGTIVKDYYAYIDSALGDIITDVGPDATIFVISDHGMKAVNQNATFDPDLPPSDINSGDHQDAPPGVIFAAGPNIRKLTSTEKTPTSLMRSDLIEVCGVLDITPAILAMLRIPIGLDMDGEVPTKIFTDQFQITHQPAPVDTHDTAEFFSKRLKSSAHPGKAERLEQLRSLGYIGND